MDLKLAGPAIVALGDETWKTEIGTQKIEKIVGHLNSEPCLLLVSELQKVYIATGLAVGMCCFQLARNLLINPEVRVNKDSRAAGILENFEEGEKYAEHTLRKFVRTREPEIMPSINKYFTESK